jgi:uncharacterized ferritin-like protein (DUF455 family)
VRGVPRVEDRKPIILEMPEHPTDFPAADRVADGAAALPCVASAGAPPSLRRAALALLCLDDPAHKARDTRALFTAWQNNPGAWHLDPREQLTDPGELPGRPALPRLVPPKEVPSRSAFTLEGRAGLLHAIAHIEFNAINLALDAVWRFADMPPAYYHQWLQVAHEEALHFSLLCEHLATLGSAYGDFDAHDGLWLMTQRTAHDVLARMALVPRTLEARGLDATPPLQAKLARAGDNRAVQILDLILRDEIGHVAIGNHWFHWLCERQGLEPVAAYQALARAHQAPRLRPPFNLGARRDAGFTEPELAQLQDPIAP